MHIIKSSLLLTVSVIFSYFFAVYLYNPIYSLIYRPSTSGIFVVYEEASKILVVLVLTLILSITLTFTTFGGSRKYWWIGVLLLPAAIFEIYFDLEHIYIPIVVGFIGWSIGFVISKIIKIIKK